MHFEIKQSKGVVLTGLGNPLSWYPLRRRQTIPSVPGPRIGMFPDESP